MTQNMKQSVKQQNSHLEQSLAKPRLLLTILLLLLFSWLLILPDVEAYQAICDSSSPGTYTVTVCIEQPISGATISGEETVSASVSVTGNDPGIQRATFYLSGDYLLTDFAPPFTFTLPSEHFVDGAYTLSAEAFMRDGYTSISTTLAITFTNGITSTPINMNTFTPYTATEPPTGEPLVVAATGDGASGRPEAAAVSDAIVDYNPDMFLYLGDVYEQGSYTEFFNWYGTPEHYFGRFAAITNPVIGNHEEKDGLSPGYDFYWDNPPDYYSFDNAGWHFIVLNSNLNFEQFEPGTAQYDWLEQDLSNNTAHCTMASFHHPRFSVGFQGNTLRMDDIWQLLAQNDVDVVLTGHDHNYQRWEPLNASGNPATDGMTQFVLGGGGQGIQSFISTDSRLEVGIDTIPEGFGSLFMNLNADGMAFQYLNIANEVADFGVIPCSGASEDTTAPTTPSNLSAPSTPNGEVKLTWQGANDNTGVESYTIYRNGNAIDTINGANLSYIDVSAQLAVSYTYTVDAVDLAGNRSPLSNPLTLTTAATRILTYTTIADTYVDQNNPTSNFGNGIALRTDASPEQNSYLRFDVQNLVGFVNAATLKVLTTSSSGIGYLVHDVADDSWNENTMTYNSAPAIGSFIGGSGSFANGTLTEVDVTTIVAGNGLMSLALRTNSPAAISYASKEEGNPATLVVELSASPPQPGSFTFNPVADTYVNADSPTSNFGTSPNLRTDASPEINSYLRFDVQGLVGFVESATLRVYANSGSAIGYDVRSLSNNSWDEGTTTFNNVPIFGPIVDSSGEFGSNSWTSVDVTSLVTSDGLVSFALTSQSFGAVSYSSRQGGNPPELIIITTQSQPPTPTPTPTPSPTPTPGAGTFTFEATHDGYVRADDANTNFGNSPQLRADASPQTNSFIRFDVQNLIGTINSATLRLFANSGSNVGIDLYQVENNTWDESTLTWNNAPSSGTFITGTAPFNPNSWIELDVTSYITGTGETSMMFTTSSNTAISISSSEGANTPQLIIETVDSQQASVENSEQTQSIPPVRPTQPPLIEPTSTPSPIQTQGSLLSAPVKESTWLQEEAASRNFGNLEELAIQTLPGNSTRALYRFDLADLPKDATIHHATLQLWVTESSSNPLLIHRITDSWSQEEVTWANGATAIESEPVGRVNTTQEGQFVSVDITALVQEWSNGSPNHGLMLIGSESHETTMLTSHTWYLAEQRPYLQIDFTENNHTLYLPLLQTGR